MSFTLRVACDVGNGKLNTGIEFGDPPGTLREVVSVIEALYSTELRVHRGDDSAKFRCVSLMRLKDGRWDEIVAADQLAHNMQLFAFDWSTPPPSSGPLPGVQFVVTAHQVRKVAARPLQQQLQHSRPRETNQSATSAGTASKGTAPNGMNSTPAAAPYRRASDTGAAPPAFSTASTANVGHGGTATRLPAEARDYLFTQLCRASSSATEVSTQRLHTIFVDYGLTFSTEQFSEIVGSQYNLDRAAWQQVEAEYGPIVDALYDRIATRTAQEAAEAANAASAPQRSVAEVRSEMLDIEEEEARILARQAELRRRAAELQRELREAEERAAAQVPNSTDDRAREWDTLQKFVSLRHRQSVLRREEERVRHELSLL